MKISLARLADYLKSPPPADEVIERLTMAGLEVDGVFRAPPVSGVVVGRVTEVRAHPDADKLKVCSVDAGAAEAMQIVCGAPNVCVGMAAPLAMVGARLGDLEIRRAKLRGVESNGMLCSGKELGINDSVSGLLELDADSKPGAPLSDYLNLGDVNLDIDLTPNRPDCFSVRGVARELAALNGKALRKGALPKYRARAGEAMDYPIDVREPQACPRYLACVIRNIPQNLATPLWIRERLWAGGMQAIHPVVDVLNMWMLEIGQPMHAFDLDRLSGAISVRMARAKEEMKAIGGDTVALPANCLVVADDEGAAAAAGIIGGERTEVTANTRNALIECAFFSPQAIAGRARAMRKHTESSLRFERGVDWQLQREALTRAVATIAQMAPEAEIGGVLSHCAEAHLPQPHAIAVARADIEEALGVRVDMSLLKRNLKASGCELKGGSAKFECAPPSWRFDLAIPADITEEAGRFYGYDRIPETADAPTALSVKPPSTASVDKLGERLRALGYFEVITLSFGAPKAMRVFSDEEPLVLENPIAAELSAMRTSLWPGLIQTLRYNLNRGCETVRIFECGRAYTQSGDKETMIAGLAYGAVEPEQWGAQSRACDFYDVKGDLEMLFKTPPIFERATRKGLHAGQTASMVTSDGQAVGCVGALSPAEEAALDVPAGVFLFELRPRSDIFDEQVKVEELSKYPQVRNDISMIVRDEIPAEALVKHIYAQGIADLKRVSIFDVFYGASIGRGEKSISLCLIYQKFSSTLSNEEVTQWTQKIVQSLEKEFHARPRQ